MRLAAMIAVGLALALGALWLLLRRGDIAYATLEARYAAPTSRFADLAPGLRAHYRDDGDPAAPTVVLIHGFGDSFLSWEGWIARLSPRFRVLTIDLPGHGLTRAPAGFAPTPEAYDAFLNAVLDAAGAPRAALVGNSMGGAIAWRFAAAHKDRVSALVLVAAAGWPNETPAPPSLAFRLMTSAPGRWLLERVETRPLTAASLRATYGDPSAVTDAFVERWVAVQRAPGHRAILMRMQPGPPATAERLAAIAAPTLILHGGRDTVIEPASAGKFAAAIAGARAVVYPGVGHMPQVEIAERSAGDAAAFLEAALRPPPT